MNRCLLAFLLLLLWFNGYGQYFPAEGSHLHYRIIAFRVPVKVGICTIEIAKGNINNLDSFEKNIVKVTQKLNSGMVIAEVPDWGAAYTWRLVTGKKPLEGLHHFSTLNLPFTDVAKYRLKVSQPATQYSDAFVFCDANRVLYDMKGNAVWVLPDMEGIVSATTVIRDLKLSPAGTITFMTMTMAYEIDFSGKILWRAPNTGAVSGEKTEHYHHEFTRLSNGHYMTLGHEMLSCTWQKTGINDSALTISRVNGLPQPTNGGSHFSMPFGTVLEYNASGQLIWSWKYFNYFIKTQQYSAIKDRRELDSHENAFYFDEKAGYVYLSFKNANQVLKISYPQGQVTQVYNGLEAATITGLFCQQHACKKSAKGYVYLFNNNFCNPDSLPTVIKLKEPVTQKDKIKKIWEYKCPISAENFVHPAATTGGNVCEMPGDALFVSLCSPYGNMFIVNANKQKLWNADLEKWDIEKARWIPQEQYRASIITDRKKLEQLVRSAAKAQ